MINEVILLGRVVKKPVLKEVGTAIKLSTCVLEIEKGFKNGVGVVESDFVTVVLWRGIAETLVDCAQIGSMIGVKGRLQTRTIETSEKQRITLTEVVAEKVTYIDKYFLNRDLNYKTE